MMMMMVMIPDRFSLGRFGLVISSKCLLLLV